MFERLTAKKRCGVKKYGLSVAAGVVLFVFAAVVRLSGGDFQLGDGLSGILMLLSDACLLPGAILCSVGALIFISGTGMFDIISYTLTSLTGGGAGYYEYKNQKKAKKRNPTPMLFAGVGFLFLSIVFGFLYCHL